MSNDFDGLYAVLYETVKTTGTGPFQYWSVYLLRKMLYAYIVFYFKEEEYTLFQIVLNILLSLMFALYIAFA